MNTSTQALLYVIRCMSDTALETLRSTTQSVHDDIGGMPDLALVLQAVGEEQASRKRDAEMYGLAT